MTMLDNFLGDYLEEDEALKSKLQGLTVSDINKPAQAVQVFFSMPQQELRRRQPPYGTISFTGDQVAPERQHRGQIQWAYVPGTDEFYQEEVPGQQWATPPYTDAQYWIPWPNTPPTTDFPIPLDLNYQVDFYTRSNRQLKQLMGTLNQPGLLHPRFAYLNCPGGTVRRIVVVSKNFDARFDENTSEKRLFRLTYELQVSSEITPQVALGTRVQNVVLTMSDMNRNPFS